MTKDEEQELFTLIELQRKAEQYKKGNGTMELDDAERHADLLKKHPLYKNLNSEAMVKKYEYEKNAPANQEKIKIITDDPNVFIKAFNEKYPKEKHGKEPWYKEPEVDKKTNAVSLSFPSAEKAQEFAADMASQKNKFTLCNQKNEVVAYSNGDGNLYHPGGKPFKAGDKFEPGTPPQKLEDIQLDPSAKESPKPG